MHTTLRPRATGLICQYCQSQPSLLRRAAANNSALISNTVSRSLSHLSPSENTCLPRRARRPDHCLPSSRQKTRVPSCSRSLATASAEAPKVQDLNAQLSRVEAIANDILTTPGVPTEEKVLDALKEYQTVAQALLSSKSSAQASKVPTENGNTAASALLSSVKKNRSNTGATKAQVLSAISALSLDILQHKPTFITAPVLKTYITLQSLLGHPESFPLVFDLYRWKPTPRASSSTITYTPSNPDKPAAAIPPAIADTAIDAAIATRDLSLTLATVDSTYCTTAYKRSKFLRSALFPLAGLLLTPPAAYTLAQRFSDWQNTMDPAQATQIAMAGILTYTGAVAMTGYVALTTANDQMVRVTWATGMPLWERWVREEERGAVDKVAQAWGFKAQDKWGEEEGEDWEKLKEWLGLRGMMLDRVELMEGME